MGWFPEKVVGREMVGTGGGKVDQAFIAHVHGAPALGAIAAVCAAFASTTVAISATCAVKAASAITDILTIAIPSSIGAAGNALKVLLTTAAGDTLAVTKTDGTGTINISLAATTATKNTASLIQAAIRSLTTVGGVSVAAVTCAAGGNWDTAAIATGESGSKAFTGGQTEAANVLTSGITSPAMCRNVTATAGGTAGDIKAVQVIVEGTNAAGKAISETLPVFTENTAGTVVGNKAFKTVTKITIPAHDGTGATTSVGTGAKLGLYHTLAHDTVLKAAHNNVAEAVSVLATSASAVEANTAIMTSALDGAAVDIYYMA